MRRRVPTGLGHRIDTEPRQVGYESPGPLRTLLGRRPGTGPRPLRP